MSLKFFADHCIPRSVIEMLRCANHDVKLLKEYIPIDSPDLEVISKAQELGAILISLNGDFANIVRYPPRRYKGILSLQVRNHPEIIPQLMERLLGFLSLYPEQEFYKGKLLLVEVHRIRIRK